MSDSLQLKLYGAVFAAAFACNAAYTFGTAEDMTFTVETKEATKGDSGKYLVKTENQGMLQVADSYLNLHFNASDVYFGLKEGHTYKADTYGWRFGLMSMYPNVIAVEDVTPAEKLEALKPQ
tara:strand:+ start:738404 stop:738769 length:366 start_codon:yes stop_codon:yes gene_type:complete